MQFQQLTNFTFKRFIEDARECDVVALIVGKRLYESVLERVSLATEVTLQFDTATCRRISFEDLSCFPVLSLDDLEDRIQAFPSFSAPIMSLYCGYERRRSLARRKSRDVAFVVHTLMQDANDVDTVCCMSIKQNVRSGRIHAVAAAHFVAFPT